MSEPIIVTTDEAPYTHNEDDFYGYDINPLNTKTWYYKLQATITGSGDSITQKTTILRSKKSGGTFIVIGTYNNNKIVLNNKADGMEQEAVGGYNNPTNEDLSHVIMTDLWNNLQQKINALDFSNTEIKKIEKSIKGSSVAKDGNGGNGGENGEKGIKVTTIDINTGVGIINTISIKGNRRSKYDKLYYPSTLESNKQDRIRFEQLYTEGTKLQTTFATGVKQFQRKQKKLKGSVTSENLISKGSLASDDDAGKGVHPRAIIILLTLSCAINT